jgi:RNA polymerase sigma-70 factor (ECF subfamily)
MRMDKKESELVAMVLSGNSEAFGPLVSPYAGTLLSVALRLTGDAEEAREAVQEALLKAFRHLAGFDPRRSFRNWLLTITANTARDCLRRKRRERRVREALESGPTASFQEPGDPAGGLRIELERCLGLLTEGEREVFVLRDLEGLDIKETAEILNRSSIAVRVRLCSARKKIRDALLGQGG